jgi:hypothetical protein
MNFLKGYRTIIFNAATAIAALAQMTDVINVVSPDSAGLVLLAVGIANLVLRYLTDTAVGVSAPK